MVTDKPEAGRCKIIVTTMTQAQINGVKEAWPELSGIVQMPHGEKEYLCLIGLLDHLIDEVGEAENHPLASLMEVIGVLIEKYEDEHVPQLRPQSRA